MARKNRNGEVAVRDVATICVAGERLTWAEYLERQQAIHRNAHRFIAATQGRKVK